MKETCSCGAKFAIVDVSLWSTEALLEAFTAWRTTHIHEIQAQDSYPEPTMVVESSARVESALPFGFTLEMEGDLS